MPIFNNLFSESYKVVRYYYKLFIVFLLFNTVENRNCVLIVLLKVNYTKLVKYCLKGKTSIQKPICVTHVLLYFSVYTNCIAI